MLPQNWLKLYSRLSHREQSEVWKLMDELDTATDKAHDAPDHLRNIYCVDCIGFIIRRVSLATMKQCSLCERWKRRARDFYRDAAKPDGRMYTCIKCTKASRQMKAA